MSQIPLFKVSLDPDDVMNELYTTISSGMLTQGKKVERYEEELKKFFDWPYIVTLNSATSGLSLAYQLLNLTRFDKVVSTPLSCFATTSAILANTEASQIVWADVADDCNIDLDNVMTKLTPETRVLSFVHWGGNPVNMDKVREVQAQYYKTFGRMLHVVQDCAHAFGARWDGKCLGVEPALYHDNGTLNDDASRRGQHIAVYSTQAIKHLTTGDGGFMVLPNEAMYKRAKLLRWYGIDRERRSLPGQDFRLEPDIPEAGYKFHMNDINASIGLANLPRMPGILQRCVDNGTFYNRSLQGLVNVAVIPAQESAITPYWIYTLRILNGQKTAFTEYMKGNNVVVSQVHARNDKHSCVQSAIAILPNLNRLENEIISIPVGAWVSDEDRERIVQLIRAFDVGVVIDKLRNARSEADTIGAVELYNPSDAEHRLGYMELLSQLNGHTISTPEERRTGALVPLTLVIRKYDIMVAAGSLAMVRRVHQDPLAHIEDVVVHKDCRGNGLGLEIMDILTQYARELGCYKVIASCKDNLTGFYEKAGYAREGVSMVRRLNESVNGPVEGVVSTNTQDGQKDKPGAMIRDECDNTDAQSHSQSGTKGIDQ